MNSITITGNIGKDAELRYMQDGSAICNFSVADNQGKDKPSLWWNCALWGKRSESLAQYLSKGQQVTVIGTVSEREFVDKDGQKRKSMDVRVSDVALQGGKREEAAPAPRAPAKAPVKQASGFDDFDSDTPF